MTDGSQGAPKGRSARTAGSGRDESRVRVEYEALRALVRNRHMTVEQGLLLLEIPEDDRRFLLKLF